MTNTLDAVAATTARAPVGASPAPPPSVDRSGSADFDEAMASAMRPPEGGCQCEARAATVSQAPVASAIPPSTTSPTSPTQPASAVRSAPVVPGDGDVVPPPSCGECGLPFSIDDPAEPAPVAPAATTSNLAGIQTGWALAATVRVPRSISFETE